MGAYKFYKFSVYDPNNEIANVTFEITPLHGDSDLFVSRNDSIRFPNKMIRDLSELAQMLTMLSSKLHKVVMKQ
jgi:hypothetical protein